MKQKANEMESNGLVAIFNLAEKYKLIDLATILQSRVTEECLSVYNVDASMRKTQKSKLLEKYLLTPVLEVPREYVSLIDMGYIWHLKTPTPKDKESLGLEYTWGDYTSKVASQIIARHQNASKVFSVNDIYDQDYNIKDDEHEVGS